MNKLIILIVFKTCTLFSANSVQAAGSELSDYFETDEDLIPTIKVELINSNTKVYIYEPLYNRSNESNSMQKWYKEINRREPLEFTNEQIIFWERKENTPSSGAVPRLRLTCENLEHYSTKWLINTDSTSPEDVDGASYFSATKKGFIANYQSEHWSQQQENRLNINSFGMNFLSGSVECVVIAVDSRSIHSKLYMFQRIDSSTPTPLQFDDSPSKDLDLSLNPVIPCKTHDPDRKPKLLYKMFNSTNWEPIKTFSSTYNWKVGFRLQDFRHNVGDKFRCELRRRRNDTPVSVEYTFVRKPIIKKYKSKNSIDLSLRKTQTQQNRIGNKEEVPNYKTDSSEQSSETQDLFNIQRQQNQNQRNGEENHLNQIILIAGAAFAAILLFFIGCFIHYYCIISKSRLPLQSPYYGHLQSIRKNLQDCICCQGDKNLKKKEDCNVEMKNVLKFNLLKLPSKYQLAVKDITVDLQSKTVAEGQFSRIYYGTLKRNSTGKVKVLIKFNKLVGDARQFDALLRDIQMKLVIGDKHPNIASFLGVYIDRDAGKVQIAMSSENALCLRKYFETNQNGFTGKEKISKMSSEKRMLTLLTWCKGVADAMVFLHGQNVVHGNLAAENILLYPNNLVKLSGFSHSQKMICAANYFVQPRCWIDGWKTCGFKWMPMESLRYYEFSKQSDIWSFGVLVWEIFSLGAIPYTDIFSGFITFSMEFVMKLEYGLRMLQPKWANREIYKIMEDCWSPFGKDRPTFMELCRSLKVLLNSKDAGTNIRV